MAVDWKMVAREIKFVAQYNTYRPNELPLCYFYERLCVEPMYVGVFAKTRLGSLPITKPG